MKRFTVLILITIHFSIANQIYAQKDTLYFIDGSKKAGSIGRVGINNFRFLELGDNKYQKIKREQIKDYTFSDDLFQMNDDKRMEVVKVYSLEGFRKDEIFRAMQDWIKVNQKLIFFNGIQLSNEEYAIVIGSLSTQEYFRLDLETVSKALDGIANTYRIHYTIRMRAKEGRLKVYIYDINIVNNIDPLFQKPFIELYRRRVNKDGLASLNLKEIKTIKALLKTQLLSIQDHAEYVRLNDTIEANLIKIMLADDEW